MHGREFKDRIYEQFARISKAMASPRRLELLDVLCQGPRTVEELAKQTGLGIPNTSQHLKVLRSARLIEGEKEGLYVTYRLADGTVCDFYRGLRALAEERLAEVEQVAEEFLKSRAQMEPVDRGRLLERVDSGEVTVLDVRPPEEYAAGHIAGAISIPLSELASRLSELPADEEIVAYCRGAYCVLAVTAVELLRSHGFRAVRLEDGVPDWHARGRRVEVGGPPPGP